MSTQEQSIEERIASRITQSAAKEIMVSAPMGGLTFENASQVMDFARILAISGIAIPKHLRGNPGACLAIVIQAIEWRLSPYAVANKSYSVNDRLAYESQLIQAVILQRAPIKGRFKVEYKGTGNQRTCRVWAELKDDGEIVEYESPPFGWISPKNSPLWKTDPDQQQFYYAGRALCRRHFPDVLLGIYAKEELEIEEIGPDRARDVTPVSNLSQIDRFAAESSEPAPAFETTPEPEPPAAKKRGRPTKAEQEAREKAAQGGEEGPQGGEAQQGGPDSPDAAGAPQEAASEIDQATASEDRPSPRQFADAMIALLDKARSLTEVDAIARDHRPRIKQYPNADDRMDLSAIFYAYLQFAGQAIDEAHLEREVADRLVLIDQRMK